MNSNSDLSFFKNIKSDLPASIVVFLVAVPLCLGIAFASGAPAISGIIAGIVGGIVVGALSGSQLGVSGPAAGLAVIVLTAIEDLGGIDYFDVFLLAVVLAGVFQMILGFIKAGVIGYYFPSSVIKGMLSGIGIIIFIKQIPHAVGYDKDPEGDFSFNQVDGHNTFSELSYMLDSISPGAVVIAAVSLAILILWEQPFMKKIPLFKIIQGPLVAVATGIGLNKLFESYSNLKLTAEQSVNIEVVNSFDGFKNLFTTPDFSHITNPEIYVLAITIAVVASLETLLCVEATDKLDPQKRVTPTNRELVAQGAGNIVSGLIGGLPVTQVIVRSSANIQSGGKTKTAAILHGFLILISLILLPNVLNMIPLASLAAILFVVGYKLAKPSIFKEMYSMGKTQFIPFIVTILGIVFTDLLMGIGLGLAFAIVHILWNNYQTPYKRTEENGVLKICFSEDVSFLNKARVLKTLDELPDDSHLIIDGSRTINIHPDVLEIIKDFKDNADKRGVKLDLVNLDI